MSRFGDFTLLEDYGKSAVADRFKAVHASLGGPFFLKVYRRLDPKLRADLKERGDLLIGKSHPHLAQHLGHGDVDGVPFVVSPWLDGLDLGEFSSSLRERRVQITLDHCVHVLVELARAVAALHAYAPPGSTGSRLAHGDVSLTHVRLGPEGQLWLTGLCTPRSVVAGRPPEARFDLAGVAALLYDLVSATQVARQPLPTPLDRVIRRGLGIGPPSEHLSPSDFADRLREVADALRLSSDPAPFLEVVKRTQRAVEKRLLESGGRPLVGAAGRRPVDTIPELLPVGAPARAVPTLEPLRPTLEPLRPSTPPAPARLQELTPLAPRPPAVPPPVPPPTPPMSTSTTSTTTSPTTIPPATMPPMTLAPPPTVPPRASTTMPPPMTPPAAMPPPTMPAPTMPAASPTTMPPVTLAPPPRPPTPTAAPPPLVDRSPRPATLPFFPTPKLPPPEPPRAPPPSPAVDIADLLGLDAASKRPRPKSTLLSDADETGVTQRPTSATTQPSADPFNDPTLSVPFAPPPTTEPPAPTPSRAPSQSFLRGDTDPDAVRPARIEAQRALPAARALVAAGVVHEDDVERAANEQVHKGGRTLEILVAHGVVDDDTVAAALARATVRPLVSRAQLVVRDAALLRRIPQTYALARRLLPLSLDGGVLVLAVADPFENKVIDEVRTLLHAHQVDVRVAVRKALTEATVAAFALVHGTDVENSGPRILLAMHDATKAQKLGDRLAQEGMQVELVNNGETARQIITTRPPSAAICAHDLPILDGRGLLLATRALEHGAELPFFVLGPRGDDDLIARVLDLGADDFFGEPLRLDVILAKLRRAVDKKRAAEVSSPGRSAPPQPAAPPPPPPKPSPQKPPPRPTAAPVPPDPFGGFDDLPDLPPEFEGEPSNDVPAMPTGVMGTLRQMALPEIVQSLEMGRKTASVDIVPADGEKGMIAFDTGAIRYAESGPLRGDQAFFALMRHKEGFFRIHYGDAPPAHNIDSPTTFLLLEAMRLMDEEGMV